MPRIRGTDMHFGAAMFFTDYSMAPGELGRALEERGFEFALGAGAFAYSRVARFAVSGRRRSAEAVLRRDGSVRHADRGRGGDEDAEGRHRRLPGAAARSDPDREAGGLDRPGLRRALPVRRRLRLERRGNGGPRHAVQVAPQDRARAHRGDEGDLDRGPSRSITASSSTSIR